MKIDIHTHVLPPSLPRMRQLTGYGGWTEVQVLVKRRHGDVERLGKEFRS